MKQQAWGRLGERVICRVVEYDGIRYANWAMRRLAWKPEAKALFSKSTGRCEITVIIPNRRWVVLENCVEQYRQYKNDIW